MNRAELDAIELMLRDLNTRHDEIRHRAAFRGCTRELLARIRALLRRSSNEDAKVLAFADVEVDLTRRVVKKKGEELKLTRAEYNLLTFFLQNPAQILTLWEGGMSFHGGLLGVIVAILAFSMKNGISPFLLSDLVSIVTPIGLFFGRLANFVNFPN